MNYRCRIITRMLWCLAALFPALAATSCADLDETFSMFGKEKGENTGLASIRYSVDGMSYGTRSAVVAAQHETKLNHVHVMFFSSLDDSYITAVQAQVITNETDPLNVKRTFSFSIPSVLRQGVDYKVIAVGNGDNFVPCKEDGSQYDSYLQYIEAICPGRTYSEVKNGLEFYNPLPMCAASTPLLPMYGELINSAHVEIPFNYEIDGDEYIVKGEFYFKRAVSRIDFSNLIPDKFMVDYVKLVNIREGALAYQDGKNCGSVVPGLDGDGITSPIEGTNGWVSVDNNLTNGQQQVKASLYAFPNIVASTGPNDEITTAILIAGRYGKDTGLTYYRFNLSSQGEPLSMLRNHIYTAVVKNITGRGDATEEEAMRREKPVVSAEVVEDWDDDTSVTTDSDGNFLILSRTTVTLDGVADQTEIIQVKVNEGTSWTLEIVEQTGHNNDKFEIKPMGDGESFYVKTLEDNTSYVLRRGFVNIVATTPQGNKLIAPFIVQQVPNEEDPKYLLVENNSTNYSTTVAGVGGSLNLQVETGSTVEGWTCKEVQLKNKTEKKDDKGNVIDYTYEFTDITTEYRDEITNKFKDTTIGTYTSNGGHMGHLLIDLKPNITKSEREVYLKVERVMPAGYKGDPVEPIYVIIKQPKSEYLISIFPYPENGTLYIEGFKPVNTEDSKVIANAITAQEEIFVSLADPDNYTVEVTSSFDYYRDLRLSQDAKLPVETTMEHSHSGIKPTFTAQDTNLKLTGLTNGQKFFINVFGTGPGDPDINGEIVVRAVPTGADAANHETQEITFHVTITTNCKIDDVFLPKNGQYLLVADRNCGAKPRLNDNKGFVPALNYSACQYMHISGYGDINYTDYNNADFRGEYYQYSTAQSNDYGNSLFFSGNETTRPDVMYSEFTEKNLDVDELYSSFYKLNDKKWRMPLSADFPIFYNYLRWSKNRPYIVSSIMDNSGVRPRYVGCFIPLDRGAFNGIYWSSTYNGDSNSTQKTQAKAFTFDWKYQASISNSIPVKTEKYLFRPVRDVTVAEMNYYKSKFLGY